MTEARQQQADDTTVAVAELMAVLEELGVPCRPAPRTDAGGVLELPGPILVDVKTASRPTISRLQRLGIEHSPHTTTTVLVADQLDPGVRKALKDAGWGWLDRTGHLRILAGSVQIDRAIPGLLGPEPAPPDPLGRPTGLAVALELLNDEGATPVRALARAAEVSVAAAHATITQLASLGLVIEGRPRHPDLFWAVADRWRIRWFPLVTGPQAGIPDSAQALLRMRLEELQRAGWAEVGDRAAQALGARVAAEGPPRFYLPDRRALTWALRTWGEAAEVRSASSFLAVPPTVHATENRFAGGRDWPLARPLVVALDLASDGSARSREILDGWVHLPTGLQRVW